jgi:HAD superfamily hydrolase (TIGR01509 family)
VTIKAVLFDLDDTLFDHRHAARLALEGVRAGHDGFVRVRAADFQRQHAEILEELHLRVMAGEIGLDAARMERFRRLFAAAGLDAGDALVRETAAAYRERYLASWRPVPGAPALLEALDSLVKIGIVSNNLLQEQEEKVRFCGFEPFVDALVVSEAVGISKPDPGIFTVALERLACEPSSAVMVGDAWRTDVAGARAAGIRPIWFNRSGGAPPEAASVTELRALEPLDAVLAAIFAAETTKRSA